MKKPEGPTPQAWREAIEQADKWNLAAAQKCAMRLVEAGPDGVPVAEAMENARWANVWDRYGFDARLGYWSASLPAEKTGMKLNEAIDLAMGVYAFQVAEMRTQAVRDGVPKVLSGEMTPWDYYIGLVRGQVVLMRGLMPYAARTIKIWNGQPDEALASLTAFARTQIQSSRMPAVKADLNQEGGTGTSEARLQNELRSEIGILNPGGLNPDAMVRLGPDAANAMKSARRVSSDDFYGHLATDLPIGEDGKALYEALLETMPGRENPEEMVIAQEEAARQLTLAQDIRNNLPPRAQSILDLTVQGLDDKQISQQLGIKPVTVRTTLTRIRKIRGKRAKRIRSDDSA